MSAITATSRRTPFLQFSGFLLILFALLGAASLPSHADVASARTAMENPDNPLLQLTTSQGQIFIELFIDEAPRNVTHILDLVKGVQELQGETADSEPVPYYDGIKFHRVIPEFLIQAGSPYHNVLGASEKVLADEINAMGLGLDSMQIMNEQGDFHPQLAISSREGFENEILIPLYRKLGLLSEAEIISRQFEIESILREMTVMEAYENLGYRYRSDLSTRGFLPGTVALANTGPNSNGSEFFINLSTEGAGLTGKYTVIGHVVEGMNIVSNISQLAVSATAFTPRSTTIFSALIIE